jgi:hypothetical protein
MPSRPLLLIACSQRKTAGMRRGRAWDIYDGALYRVLKKLFREWPEAARRVEVLIVSAKYGVVRPDQRITTYDERLTPALARRRGAFWADQLKRAVAGRQFPAVHINLGRNYLQVLPDLAGVFDGAVMESAAGGIGIRSAQTREWVISRARIGYRGFRGPAAADRARGAASISR